MPGISNITNVWNNVKEIDLRPLREEALAVVRIALVGAAGSGREALAAQLRRDPSRPSEEVYSPMMVLDLEAAPGANEAELIILLVNPQGEMPYDFSREKSLVRSWADANKRVLVFVNQPAEMGKARTFGPWVEWGQRRVVYGAVDDTRFLVDEFAPAVIETIPDRVISLGRHFPLFRVPVAHHLINDTCFSNAAYSISTGLAEVVPVLGIPLNVTDMVVLTKNQAFLVYKLGLALGLSTDWRDYVTEFGSVLGGGFLWRQIARSLVGLIPAWGVLPKVAVAYSGTYVVGNVVLQWYLTGRHVSASQMRALYSQAFARGKNVARSLLERAPRPRLGRRRKPEALPEVTLPDEPKALPEPARQLTELTQSSLDAAALERDEAALDPHNLPEDVTIANPPPAQLDVQVCHTCGRSSSTEMSFCPYCGTPFRKEEAEA